MNSDRKFRAVFAIILAATLAFVPGLAFADEAFGEFADDVAAAALVEDAADAGSGVAGEETGVESGDSAEAAADGAASGEQSADESADDAAVADDAADEVAADVAEDAAVEGAALADESAPEEAVADEAAPAEAPMTLMAKSSAAAAQGHWEVTASRGHGLQRYWIEADGSVAKNRLIDPAEGSGWWAFARPEGYVVRGKYAAKDGKVYLANNDGKLENPGWVVTKAYDGGYQRYWIDAEAHAAVPGYSRDGWVHYTLPNKGYVTRGAFTDSNGRKMTADNDGRVKGGVPRAYNGWVVANLGAGLQRYWFRNDVMARSELLDAAETGWWAYARPEGYVVRGKYAAKDGKVYLANNDGRLESPGWLVTNKYDGGYQRYWIDSNAHAAVPGYSAEGWAHYTLPTKGYVARGKVSAGGYMLFANNDGKIASEKTGWLVTNKYDGGMQRYWIEDCGGYTAAKLGKFSVSGKQYYGREDRGYVVRGFYCAPNGDAVFANNDGVMFALPALSSKIMNACKAVPSPGPGLCAAWVSSVVQRLTGALHSGDADDLFYSWCKTSDYSKLKPGMAIAVPTHGHTYLGGIYGHICIYLGDNLIMDNVGTIRTMKLGEWLAWYGDRRAPQWGWIGGRAY